MRLKTALILGSTIVAGGSLVISRIEKAARKAEDKFRDSLDRLHQAEREAEYAKRDAALAQERLKHAAEALDRRTPPPTTDRFFKDPPVDIPTENGDNSDKPSDERS